MLDQSAPGRLPRTQSACVTRDYNFTNQVSPQQAPPLTHSKIQQQSVYGTAQLCKQSQLGPNPRLKTKKYRLQVAQEALTKTCKIFPSFLGLPRVDTFAPDRPCFAGIPMHGEGCMRCLPARSHFHSFRATQGVTKPVHQSHSCAAVDLLVFVGARVHCLLL